MTIDLPAKFWQDHDERALPAGKLIKVVGNRVRIECTEEELAEILDDAKFYSDVNGPDQLPPGLKASAKATVRAIERFREMAQQKCCQVAP